jgi:ElaB/YqjD/DUF883 family membrane-anchored ribosome-binding protein
MNRLTAFLKRIRFGQILTVFLAGILVFISTACNRADVTAGKTADQIRKEVPSEAVTSQYKGGQNQYSDVDPRNANMTSVEAKAQLLKDQAQRRIDTKSSNNVGENVRRVADDAPDKLSQIGQKVKEDVRAAKQNAEEFGENAKQGFANIKENTREGVKGAKEIAKEAGMGVKERVAEGTESLKYNVSQGKENVKDAGRAVKYNAEDASDKVRSKVSRDIDKTQRAAERAVDAID